MNSKIGAVGVEFFVILAALVVAYLGIVEAAKRIFYRHLTIKPK